MSLCGGNVAVGVGVGACVAVGVADCVGVGVGACVAVGVAVCVGVGVDDSVAVGVAVCVGVGVGISVAVGVADCNAVGIEVGAVVGSADGIIVASKVVVLVVEFAAISTVFEKTEPEPIAVVSSSPHATSIKPTKHIKNNDAIFFANTVIILSKQTNDKIKMP